MNKHILNTAKGLFFSAALVTLAGCEREISTDVLATSPKVAEVFLDEFAAGVDFQAWGKTTALSQDNETKYSGTASLKIEVPTPDDFLGNWTGGVFFTEAGRDLSDYDALTFYVKSSASTKIEVGLGSYGDSPEYTATIAGVTADANWRKVIIPIPNPAKLTAEKGLFNFSAGTNDTGGQAYTLWIDEVKYEKLGTLAHTRIENMTMAGFPSGDFEIGTLAGYVNLPNGIDQKMTMSSKYFTFESSNPEIATINENVITFHGGKGKVVFTPKEAQGSITVTDVYDFAPVPSHNEANVISLYSDKYTNTLSSPFNGYWDWQTTSNNEINAGGDHIMHYGTFNYVGIVLDNDADCSDMDCLHIDILLMDESDGNQQITVEAHQGGGDAVATVGKKVATLKTGEWISVDVPLDANTNLVHELMLQRPDGSNYQDILVDNIYFYKN